MTQRVDKAIRLPSATSWVDFVDVELLRALHARQFSRPVAGWIRFFILASLFRSSDALAVVGDSLSVASYSFVLFCLFCIGQVIFGFLWLAILVCFINFFGCRVGYRPPYKVGILVAIALVTVVCPAVSAMPLSADTGEEARRASRRGGTELFADRVVRQRTRCYRETLLKAFDDWLRISKSICLDTLLDAKPIDAEAVAGALTEFGREMYYAGKPYGRFSETINAVASRRPVIRKALVQAWDLAFAWQADEPREHHPAMPLSVLLAICSLALLWGWPHEAAIFAMTWSGIFEDR